VLVKNSSTGRGLVREERLQIVLGSEELKAVDNFRFFHRMPSRAAAVRELLRHGLAAVVIRKQGSKTHSLLSRDGHFFIAAVAAIRSIANAAAARRPN
jgi:thiamine monophosphate synthase